ncbi:MAG: hypothetical protein KIT22_12240, partial [Verrucomicrobiae bacterium]|nr:hypothetical protein [Verrucomicrobiae bacterium]
QSQIDAKRAGLGSSGGYNSFSTPSEFDAKTDSALGAVQSFGNSFQNAWEANQRLQRDRDAREALELEALVRDRPQRSVEPSGGHQIQIPSSTVEYSPSAPRSQPLAAPALAQPLLNEPLSSFAGAGSEGSAGKNDGATSLRQYLGEWGFYEVGGGGTPAALAGSTRGWAEAPDLPVSQSKRPALDPGFRDVDEMLGINDPPLRVPTTRRSGEGAGANGSAGMAPARDLPSAEELQRREDRAALPPDATERLAFLTMEARKHPQRFLPLLQEEERKQGLPITPGPTPATYQVPPYDPSASLRNDIERERAAEDRAARDKAIWERIDAETPSTLGNGSRGTWNRVKEKASEIIGTTRDTVLNELFGQATVGEVPNLREAARNGIGTTAAGVADSAYEAARTHLPADAATDADIARATARSVRDGAGLRSRLEAGADNAELVRRRLQEAAGSDGKELGLDELFGSPKK